MKDNHTYTQNIFHIKKYGEVNGVLQNQLDSEEHGSDQSALRTAQSYFTKQCGPPPITCLNQNLPSKTEHYLGTLALLRTIAGQEGWDSRLG